MQVTLSGVFAGVEPPERPRYIWITRPGGGGLSDARFLARRGYFSLYAPLTRIVPAVDTQLRLREAYNAADGAALAFTSPNAVRAVSACFSAEEKSNITALTAGHVTDTAAQNAGFGRVIYAGAGGAAAARIAVENPDIRALIHCSGGDIRTDIAAIVRESGKQAQRIVTYTADETDILRRNITLLRGGYIAAVMFCSVKAASLWKKHLLIHEPVAIKRKPAYYCLSNDIKAVCLPRERAVFTPAVPYPAVLRQLAARRQCQ